MVLFAAVLFWTTAAGACIPLGAGFARICPQWLEEEVRHFVLALGGGALVARERAQARAGRAAPQSAAMAADYLPETLALGGMFAANAEGAMLLAVLIGLQNLPEGFNAWRELVAGRFNLGVALALMC